MQHWWAIFFFVEFNLQMNYANLNLDFHFHFDFNSDIITTNIYARSNLGNEFYKLPNTLLYWKWLFLIFLLLDEMMMIFTMCKIFLMYLWMM